MGLLVDLLNPAGGALLQPFNIWIVGGWNRSEHPLRGLRRDGSWVPPAPDLCMPVHERNSASPVMIAGGDISKLSQVRLVRETAHVDKEVPEIDHIRSFVPE